MLKVGITGGIGSGKTTVCRVFQSLGVPVYNADDAAKTLMATDENVKSRLITVLGNVYEIDGNLNRKRIAELVFNDPQLLEAINNIVHPAVIADYAEWESTHFHSVYCIRESAILFESGTHKGLDKIILVSAPERLRLQRIIARDQRTEEQIKSIMRQQWSDDEKHKLSDHVIVNDDVLAVLPQVLNLHQLFSTGAQR